MSFTQNAKARAIDVGYFNVKYTLRRAGEIIRCQSFPAIAPVLQRGTVRAVSDAPAADGFSIDVDGQKYFVGREAAAMTKGVEPRRIADDYCLTPQYKALMLAALAYMAHDESCDGEYEIDFLVLGLPLTTYFSHREQLKKIAQGTHRVPGRGDHPITVHVRNVAVLVQPGGALMNVSTRNNVPVSKESISCVLDCGGGTLDWFVTSGGLRPNTERSNAYPRAMIACAAAVAEKCGGADADGWRNSVNVMNKIDRAIQARASFSVQGRNFDPSDYRSTVQGVIDEGIAEMLGSIGNTSDIDLVLCVGGGGHLYAEALRRKVPTLAPAIKVEEEPVFTNVKGFQTYADHRLASLMKARNAAPTTVGA